VPKPFAFEKREKAKKVIKNSANDDKETKNEPFKANPIPISTQLPKYEMIMAKEEARRLEVKQNSYAITKANEKPFSFYERDKEKYMARMNADDIIDDEHKPFKAKPIPPEITLNLYDQMTREREKNREERIKKRAEELLKESKLPPRMEMDNTRTKRKIVEELPSFKPETGKPVPDFAKQQADFEAALKKHKAANQATVPEPFEFREVKVFFGKLQEKIEKS